MNKFDVHRTAKKDPSRSRGRSGIHSQPVGLRGGALRRSDVQLRLGLCLLAAIAMLIATGAGAPPILAKDRRGVAASCPALSSRLRHGRPRMKPKGRPAARRGRFTRSTMCRSCSSGLDSRVNCACHGCQEIRCQDRQGSGRIFCRPIRTLRSKRLRPIRRRRRSRYAANLRSFCAALTVEWRSKFDEAVKKSLAEFEERGLHEKPTDAHQEQNQAEIIVYPEKDWTVRKPVAVKEVRIADVKPKLLINLRRELKLLEVEVVEQSRRKGRQVYALNPEPIVKLRARLLDEVNKLAEAKTFDENTAKLWQDFVARPAEGQAGPKPTDQKTLFEKFREDVATEKS